MIAIESIQPGDYVLAKDVDTGVVSYQAVLQTFENEIDVTYTISLEDEEIETTAGHPFYVEDEGFVQAQYLEVGDKIETADGESAEVESVKKNEHDEPVIIYNFEVMDDHTYYVGENSLLVHNTGSCGGDVPDAVENGSNSVPNPNGKKGGAAHQDTINSIEKTNANGKIQYEKKYNTPNGYKQSRYADAVETVDGEVTKIHQVGKVNKNGTPIMRESKAIEDIMRSPNYNGAPIYFWPYNNPSAGPTIFDY